MIAKRLSSDRIRYRGAVWIKTRCRSRFGRCKITGRRIFFRETAWRMEGFTRARQQEPLIDNRMMTMLADGIG